MKYKFKKGYKVRFVTGADLDRLCISSQLMGKKLTIARQLRDREDSWDTASAEYNHTPTYFISGFIVPEAILESVS